MIVTRRNKSRYVFGEKSGRKGELNLQAILGNDQNASPTNQKTAGSKLERTS